MPAEPDNQERTAALFRNGRSQAVRIPKEFEMPGRTVSIERREDGSLVVRPADNDLLSFIASLEPLGEDEALPDISEAPIEPASIF